MPLVVQQNIRGTWNLIFKASKRWKSVNWNIITDIERTWKMKQKIKKNVLLLYCYS